MTRARREMRPGGDAGRDIAWMMGPLPGSMHDYRKDASPEIHSQMNAFDHIWNSLKNNLQEPIRNESGNFGGFTGHRIVTFEDEMGRCALGFNLQMVATDLYRTITASRRKLYEDDEPRLELMADEFHISMNEVRYHDAHENAMHEFRLGVMAVWANKYLAVQPYEELPYYGN